MNPSLLLAVGLLASPITEGPATSGPSPVIAQVAGDGAPVTLVPIRSGFAYVSGDCRVATPLPDGYPRPTAPGMIEIKQYPVVRRAQVEGSGSRDDGMDGRGSTRAFWPLFRHIQSRDIAMTSPVEIDYDADGWSMSFLYRSADLGPEGAAGSVQVYDAPPVTVIALGAQGDMSGEDVASAIGRLTEWVESSGEWKIAGDPRKLSYNGPEQRAARRWHEVQIPVQRAAAE